MSGSFMPQTTDEGLNLYIIFKLNDNIPRDMHTNRTGKINNLKNI